jgi:hypothetical protein
MCLATVKKLLFQKRTAMHEIVSVSARQRDAAQSDVKWVAEVR